MKPWYKSKIILANIIAIVGMILEYLALRQIVNPELHVLCLGILNIILRTVTNTGVTR